MRQAGDHHVEVAKIVFWMIPDQLWFHDHFLLSSLSSGQVIQKAELAVILTS